MGGRGARGAVYKFESIVLPLIPLRLRSVRFSVSNGASAFILLANERRALGTSGRRETDASNSSDRSARDPRAVGIKRKKSSRAGTPPRRAARVAAIHFVPPYNRVLSVSSLYIERNSFRRDPARRRAGRRGRLFTDWSAKNYTAECNKKGLTKRRYILRTLFAPWYR